MLTFLSDLISHRFKTVFIPTPLPIVLLFDNKTERECFCLVNGGTQISIASRHREMCSFYCQPPYSANWLKGTLMSNAVACVNGP